MESKVNGGSFGEGIAGYPKGGREKVAQPAGDKNNDSKLSGGRKNDPWLASEKQRKKRKEGGHLGFTGTNEALY